MKCHIPAPRNTNLDKSLIDTYIKFINGSGYTPIANTMIARIMSGISSIAETS